MLDAQFDDSTDYIEDGQRSLSLEPCKTVAAIGTQLVVLMKRYQILPISCKVRTLYFGGQYISRRQVRTVDQEQYDVMLTVQIRGPCHGSSQWQLVGVGESPPEWGERLFLNTGVIGQLVSNIETVHAMARQNLGPPTIASAGVLSSIDEYLRMGSFLFNHLRIEFRRKLKSLYKLNIF
jgi:hypothetical protein